MSAGFACAALAGFLREGRSGAYGQRENKQCKQRRRFENRHRPLPSCICIMSLAANRHNPSTIPASG
jgi:hypothetical protein